MGAWQMAAIEHTTTLALGMTKSKIMLCIAFVGIAFAVTLLGHQTSNEAELQPPRPEGMMIPDK
jgi:hypothetical protein